MLSSSSYGKYREGNHVNKRLVADVLEDDSYKIGRSKVSGMSMHRTPKKTVKDDVRCDDGALFPSIPFFDVDDRIHNALLEELCADYGVTDSSDLDLLTFDLPSSELRVSEQSEQGVQPGSVRHQERKLTYDVTKRKLEEKPEEVNYATHKSCGTIDISKSVASPTISSSCEETHLSHNVDNCPSEANATAVHSSTNSCAGPGVIEDKPCDKRSYTPEKNVGKPFEFVRKPSDEASKMIVMKREFGSTVSKTISSRNVADDDNSVASSPDRVHIAKKAKTIANGDDLLEDVKKSYEFVRGATIFNPASSHHLSTPQSFWPQPFVNSMQVASSQSIGKSSCDSSDTARSISSDWNKKADSFNKAQSNNIIRENLNRCDSADVGFSHRYAEIPTKGDYSAGWTGSGLSTFHEYNSNSRYVDGDVQNYRQVGTYGNIDPQKELIRVNQPLSDPSLSTHQSAHDTGKTSDTFSSSQAWYTQSVGPSRNVYRLDEKNVNAYHNQSEATRFQAQYQSHHQGIASQQSLSQQCGYADVHYNSVYNQPDHTEFANHQVDSQFGTCNSEQKANQVSAGGLRGGIHQSNRIAEIGVSLSPGFQRRQVLKSGFTEPCSNAYSYQAVDCRSTYGSNLIMGVPQNDNADRIGLTTAHTNPRLSRLDDSSSFPDNSLTLSSAAHNTHNTPAEFKQNSLQRLNYPSGDVRCINGSRNPGSAMGVPSARDQCLRLPVNPVSFTDQTCQGFVRHLVGDGSGPYRLHPLFPLLRDLVIADMNFDAPSFPFPLLAGIPKSFDRLVDNFFSSNRQASTRLGIDPSMDGIIIDALRFAHSSLIDKIRCQRLKDGFQEVAPLPVEDVCSRFSQFGQHAAEQAQFPSCNDRLANSGSWTSAQVPMVKESQADVFFANKESWSALAGHLPDTNPNFSRRVDPPVANNSGLKPQHYNNNCSASVYSHQMASGGIVGSHQKQSQLNYDYVSSISEGSDSINGSEKASKNKVLPNEAKAIMVDWLRAHQENPYPNDDEKEELMSSTKLTISQINYWFTNARRRLLPKWAMQRRHAFERDSERHTAIPIL